MTSAPPDPRLQRLLGGAELAAVRQRLRRHFERAESGAASRAVRLTGLDPAMHRALCQLTGRPSRPAASLTLNIDELDEQLCNAGLADSLRDALERLEGPIRPHAKLKKERQARWKALLSSPNGGQLLRAWRQSPAALTLLKRLGREPEQAEALLFAADAVLQRLPSRGLARAQLAAETLGDAHALDVGRPVATLVLAAWRHHERAATATLDDRTENGVENDETVAEAEASTAERQRDTWARAGISVNELARPALFLNLPPPDGPRTWAVGEPGYLSLRQLLRQPPSWPVARRDIYICENPNIVAIAADRLGAHCAPLVCTDGMPAAAQRVLLDQLAAADAHLHYHGDYDWPGIAIGNHVMRAWGASPWNFGTRDYLAAVAETPPRPRDLDINGIEATWDADLATAMGEHGLAIAEEGVVDKLMESLGGDT
ncbi:MAG: TIGR02679 family protein [Alcaligenaceae bacterium]|nr:TIGR02679 family protein [Alcaligenaceae bacterium]